jgi:hypothetical protein
VSTLAVIVLVVVAVLLVAGGRKAARVRTLPALGPGEDDVTSYRSHAEASRRGDIERL